jgi:uncharacterized protein (TIGR02996 family)
MPPTPKLPPPRPEVLAFLRACKENPEDDTPRLVLADWLQEHGDEHDAARGEFIRAQCSLAGMKADDPRRKPLEQQAQELEARHGAAWLGPLAAYRRSFEFVSGFRGEYHRGLLAINQAARRLFERPLRGLTKTEAFAWVEDMTLRNAGGWESVLAAFAPLAGVTALRLPKTRNLKVPYLGVGRTKTLVLSPYLANLTLLDLSGQYTGVGGTAAVANSPHLRRLRTLLLADNKIGPRRAHALVGSPHLDHLTLLDLRGNRLTRGDQEALRARFPSATIRF